MSPNCSRKRSAGCVMPMSSIRESSASHSATPAASPIVARMSRLSLKQPNGGGLVAGRARGRGEQRQTLRLAVAIALGATKLEAFRRERDGALDTTE